MTKAELLAAEIQAYCGKHAKPKLAIRFVKRFREKVDEKAMAGLARWFTAGIGNWAHTDVLCGEILAPRITSGAVALEALAGWRSSGLKYQRRAVTVSMLGLLKVREDFGPPLEFIRPMMLDPERVVHQGLGWFLREAFQYATEKMTATARARFRREKSR